MALPRFLKGSLNVYTGMAVTCCKDLRTLGSASSHKTCEPAAMFEVKCHLTPREFQLAHHQTETKKSAALRAKMDHAKAQR